MHQIFLHFGAFYFCTSTFFPIILLALARPTMSNISLVEPVSHSDWAAPIAVVPKEDGRHRICGDYKVTVNQGLEEEQHPLPKPEDLFTTLSDSQS